MIDSVLDLSDGTVPYVIAGWGEDGAHDVLTRFVALARRVEAALSTVAGTQATAAAATAGSRSQLPI